MSTPYVSETGLHASDNEPHAPEAGLHASETEPHAPEAGLHAPEAGLHVRTVTGPLACASVRGPVLAHEHLVLDLDLKGDGAAVLDADRHGASVGAELTALREEFGLSLVVELTCRGMGRDPRALARMSRETGVAVVAATGWYYEPFHPAELTHATVEQLTATLVAETGGGGHTGIEGTGIEGTGMDGTGIRPGVIGEVGSHGEVPSEPEARSLRAAARAARTTGLSVATHAQLGRGGPAQLDVLTGEGLPRTASASDTRTSSTTPPCTGNSRLRAPMSPSTPSVRTATRATRHACGCCWPSWRPGTPTGSCSVVTSHATATCVPRAARATGTCSARSCPPRGPWAWTTTSST